jgi:DnaJ domain
MNKAISRMVGRAIGLYVIEQLQSDKFAQDVTELFAALLKEALKGELGADFDLPLAKGPFIGARRKKALTTLGLSDAASPADIKSAFKSMVKQYHPDVNKSPTATAKYTAVVDAYEALK